MNKHLSGGRRPGETTASKALSQGVRNQEMMDFEILDEAETLPAESPRTARDSRPAKFIRLAQLRKLRECQQAAAVCYRVCHGEVEFLLVQTGGGRWIFPKGGAEPGLTHAQAAALEAYEEAGVHGRIEEAAFTRYLYAKRARKEEKGIRKAAAKFAVSAHLCEVSRLEAPEESNRNPSWFTAAEAKRSFREEAANGAELVRVINCALRRIRSRQDKLPAKVVAPRKAQVIEIDSAQKISARPLPPRF
jgi:8-oxo-dGTP pyrophosphatase MutT (NUDIX family)